MLHISLMGDADDTKRHSAPIPPQAGNWGPPTKGEPLPHREILEPDGGFWVFAYGSLIWDPQIPVAERRPAALPGFRRSFCLWSIHYRGTPERPGLILGLEQAAGASVKGAALRIAPEHAEAAHKSLTERELILGTYIESMVPAQLLCEETGGAIGAQRVLAYVVDQSHEQYAGALSPEEKCAVIACAQGLRGPNTEYLFNLVDKLRAQGLSEEELKALTNLEVGVKALLRQRVSE